MLRARRIGPATVARLVRSAAFTIDVRNTLRISEEEWGRDGRVRYALLLKQALADLSRDPGCHGVREVPQRSGIFGYHLRHSRNGIPADRRVGRPRHVVFFRSDDGGDVVILLRLLHDHMLPDAWLPSPVGDQATPDAATPGGGCR